MNNLCETGLMVKGYKYICGVDEVGRGCLAGPVTVAAVILEPSFDVKDLNDSKKLSEKQRSKLYIEILYNVIDYKVVHRCSQDIDNDNILAATHAAMKEAIESLTVTPNVVLVDGNLPIRDLSIYQIPIVGGDGKIASIAAASIMAKVIRDERMIDASNDFPEFKWSKNKGYGTKEHREAINRYGYTAYHRKSFAPLKNMIADKTAKEYGR